MNTKFLILLLLIIPVSLLANEKTGAGKSRLIILADMGNEPDEVQQMMHKSFYGIGQTLDWQTHKVGIKYLLENPVYSISITSPSRVVYCFIKLALRQE